MFNTFTPSSPFLQSGSTTATKCAIPECPNPCHVDDNGTVHQCCGRSHARELEARSAQSQTTAMNQMSTCTGAPMTMTTPVACGGGGISAPPPPPPPSLPQMSSALPPSQKCAIVECPNPRYVDPSGTVHECCGITHAMEHQRRLALMQRKSAYIVSTIMPPDYFRQLFVAETNI